jgi:ABC-2 type transport system permease protein
MSTLLVLLRKDLAVFLRDKTAVALTFLVPVALIYVFGHVFGINQSSPGPAGIPFAVVNASPEPAAAKLLDALLAIAAVVMAVATWRINRGPLFN